MYLKQLRVQNRSVPPAELFRTVITRLREFRVRRSRHYTSLIQAAWKLSEGRHVLSTVFR